MKCRTVTVSALKDMFRHKQLELNPPYQRRPVWKTKQRKLLIASIFNGIPIPAIILHKHFDKKKKKDIYDVLDGKQRLETIFHFIDLLNIPNEFDWSIKIRKTSNEFLDITNSSLKSSKFNRENNSVVDKFWKYEIPVIEYEEELTDFFDNPVATMEVFVRINSTGSSLKRNEIRHANSSAIFFKLGEDLEKRLNKRFVSSWRIFSENEVQRFQFHEFIMELCTTIYFHTYTNRRQKLDQLLYNHNWKASEITQIKNRFLKIINWLRSIFSDQIFINTRFTNKSDFYSLFVVLNSLIEKKYVTTIIKDNKVLGNALLEFSKVAQQAAADIKKYDLKNSSKGYDKELLQYIIATRESTDTLANRQIRNEYLEKLLRGFILRRKDKKRIFDSNIKGILWTRLLQKSKKPKCPNPQKNESCKVFLTYEDAQIDHIDPWSKGGSTTFKNAQLICSICNKKKGNR